MTVPRRLMIFPWEAGKQDGYSLAVTADLARLGPGPGDVVIHRAFHPSPTQGLVRTFAMPTAAEKAWNLLRGRPPYELSDAGLGQCLAGVEDGFEELFSGDIFFYRALRRRFPTTPMRVRSHNLYSLARCRQALRKPPSNLHHTINMHVHSGLEMEVMADPLTTMLFITEEEFAFARLLFPLLRGECWPVVETRPALSETLHAPSVPRLVFLGSAAASHTYIGIEILCQTVFPRLRAQLPAVEFHLFGSGTEKYQDAVQGVFGHGRHPGEGLPFGGDGLFCVPDIHGMGIKLKVADLVKAGAPFIATPLGLSGYRLPPHPHILVAEMDGWAEAILGYFREAGLA